MSVEKTLKNAERVRGLALISSKSAFAKIISLIVIINMSIKNISKQCILFFVPIEDTQNIKFSHFSSIKLQDKEPDTDLRS